MDLKELKRRALTEPDPRIQAQYAAQLVKAAETRTQKGAQQTPKDQIPQAIKDLLGSKGRMRTADIVMALGYSPSKYGLDPGKNPVSTELLRMSKAGELELIGGQHGYPIFDLVRNKAARPAMRKAGPIKVGDKVQYRLYNTPEKKFYGPTETAEVISIGSDPKTGEKTYTVTWPGHGDDGLELARKEIVRVVR